MVSFPTPWRLFPTTILSLRFPWVVYANSSSPGTYESTSEDEQSTSSQGNIGIHTLLSLDSFCLCRVLGVSHVLSPQEISAQIIHVNPLLQTSTKHPHTPLIQVSSYCFWNTLKFPRAFNLFMGYGIFPKSSFRS